MSISRTVYPALADMLSYPLGGHRRGSTKACIDIAPELGDALSAFEAALQERADMSLEELYTRTFDVMPSCDPYVSSQVFGQESYKRSQLMTGLIEAYTAVEFDRGTELPDHIEIILRFAPHCSGEEWQDLVSMCLHEAVSKMSAGLGPSGNPYQHLLRAVQVAFELDIPSVLESGGEARPTDVPLGILQGTESEEAIRA